MTKRKLRNLDKLLNEKSSFTADYIKLIMLAKDTKMTPLNRKKNWKNTSKTSKLFTFPNDTTTSLVFTLSRIPYPVVLCDYRNTH